MLASSLSVSDIRHQDGNRPILTFCDILAHFPAVVQCALSQKSGAGGENRSTRTAVTADLVDATNGARAGVGGKMLRSVDSPHRHVRKHPWPAPI
jgi:hypothetical protein